MVVSADFCIATVNNSKTPLGVVGISGTANNSKAPALSARAGRSALLASCRPKIEDSDGFFYRNYRGVLNSTDGTRTESSRGGSLCLSTDSSEVPFRGSNRGTVVREHTSSSVTGQVSAPCSPPHRRFRHAGRNRIARYLVTLNVASAAIEPRRIHAVANSCPSHGELGWRHGSSSTPSPAGSRLHEVDSRHS